MVRSAVQEAVARCHSADGHLHPLPRTATGTNQRPIGVRAPTNEEKVRLAR